MANLESIINSLESIVGVAVERAEHMVLNTYERVVTNYNDKRFTVIGGTVAAKDGDIHNISPISLIRLYNVDPKSCYIQSLPKVVLENSIVLRPSALGNYTVPRVN